MRYKPISQISEGEILGSAIYDTRGRMVVGKGTTLTGGYIQKLKDGGYTGLYIEDEISEGIDVDPIISPALRAEGMECVKSMNVEKAVEVARAIVEEILEKGIVSLDMSDLRAFDDYTYAHSVNVAVLSCVIGIGMKLPQKDLEALVLAAILHDLGKLMVPPEILNKKDRLTKEEYDIMKSHVTESHRLLAGHYELTSATKNAVLFHHENMDGSGYPKGLMGDEIPLYARILHVTDIYDALTSDRPYKKGYAPADAVEYLMGGCNILVDRDIVDKFMQYVPIYPKGSEIRLSNGERAIVMDNRDSHVMRPVVRILSSGRELDLTSRENLSIAIIPNSEIDLEEQRRSEEARKTMVEKRKRVLAVDDMRTNLAILHEILHEDYEFVAVASGSKAIVAVAKEPAFDIILMDIDMPEMDGIEATKRINEMTRGEVPVLFITSVCDRATVLRCREQKAAGFIAKPFNSFYVYEEVNRIIRKWRPEY